jgi:hypothetical protein
VRIGKSEQADGSNGSVHGIGVSGGRHGDRARTTEVKGGTACRQSAPLTEGSIPTLGMDLPSGGLGRQEGVGPSVAV